VAGLEAGWKLSVGSGRVAEGGVGRGRVGGGAQ